LPRAAEVETRPVLKQCIASRAALAELKQAAELIPNQGVLINALPLLEAQASSEIENIVTTTDRLFQYQSAGEHADPATREALRYSNALLEGYQALKQFPLTTRTAEQVCAFSFMGQLLPLLAFLSFAGFALFGGQSSLGLTCSLFAKTFGVGLRRG
jgi:Fic family protein